MECMEAKALKSSFSREMTLKSVNPQGISDDFWCVSGLPTDDFSIDEFFNLPSEEIVCNSKDVGSFSDRDEEKDGNFSGGASLLPSASDPVAADSPHFPTHLALPDDDMQELELWSHFMDDSVPEPIIACSKPIIDAYNEKTEFTSGKWAEPYAQQALVRTSFFPMAVPVKPRSKRLRSIGNRSWFAGSPPKTESSSSSSSPSSPVSTLLFAPPVHEMSLFFTFGKPPVKKSKKKPTAAVNGKTGSSHLVQRRCTHCQVTKTPQWRTGPTGPKTLCNACGVRFKSGRLFPEYRPAISPTFSSQVHSNSHRKVLEMRSKKETVEPFTASPQLVSSG